MKVSFVSSQAISQAMLYQTMRMQVDLVKAQKEVALQRVADVGLALGARTGMSVSLEREVSRLEGLIDSNQLASSRLEATQLGLQQLTDSASKLLSSLTTAVSGAADSEILRQESEAILSNLTSVLNSNLNGEHLFAGINTDVRPMNDFLDPASPNRVAFDTAFATYFGFAPDAPGAAGITAADMQNFLATQVEPQFTGAGWSNWSTATDQEITSRITLTETAQTSVSANMSGFRKLAMAAAAVYGMYEGGMSHEARSQILKHALETVGEAVNELTARQSALGVTEQRIEGASERMSMQIDIFTKSLGELQGVDPYEASTKVSGLLAQIELSYSLTARIQQMSLLKYL